MNDLNVVVWIVVSIALALVVSGLALAVDALAEHWSAQKQSRQLVRRMLLIESTEKLADGIARVEYTKLALWGVLFLAAGAAGYGVLSLFGATIFYRYFPYLAVIFALVGAGFAVRAVQKR